MYSASSNPILYLYTQATADVSDGKNSGCSADALPFPGRCATTVCLMSLGNVAVHHTAVTAQPHARILLCPRERKIRQAEGGPYILTFVAMSPFSSTIEGGRSAPAVCCAVSASAVVEDARIHRLGCRSPPLLQLLLFSGLLAAERPGQAAPRECADRRRRGNRTGAALGTKAVELPEKALAATDLRGIWGGCTPGSLSAKQVFRPSAKHVRLVV